ncbi:MAG: Crp/Fnr family transcriptional regulator [Pseudomonadota bacterium]
MPLPAMLADLGAEAAALASTRLRRMTVPANAVLYYQEDVGNAVYFVESGHVRLAHIGEDGSVAFYGIIRAGRSFGEISAFDDAGYSETATTIDETTVLALDTSALEGDTPAHAELRQRMTALLAARFRTHAQMTRALYMPNLSGRLAHSLLYLLDTVGTRITVQGRSVECLGPEVTQRDLGTLARGTRENVNKMLRTWIKDDILEIEDRHIIVQSRAPLKSKAYNL